MRVHGKRTPTRSAIVVVVVALCALAGCGTGGSPSPTTAPTTTASPTPASTAMTAACSDIAALKSSVEALAKVNPAKDGPAALTGAIRDVQTSLNAASATASDSPELQPGVEQVKSALASLDTAAKGLTTRNIAKKAPALFSASRGVATAMSSLSSTASEVCE